MTPRRALLVTLFAICVGAVIIASVTVGGAAPAPTSTPAGVETGVNVISNAGFTSPQVLADISARSLDEKPASRTGAFPVDYVVRPNALTEGSSTSLLTTR